MRAISRNQAGFTLTEVVIALLLVGLATGSLLTSFLMGRVATFHARHHTQAMNLLQAKAEELMGGDYAAVQDEGPVSTPVDPGPDLIWGTDDDRMGSLRVVVADRVDLDGDGDFSEDEIDLDGEGENDPCKPVHLSLTWSCRGHGRDVPGQVSLDTLIARR